MSADDSWQYGGDRAAVANDAATMPRHERDDYPLFDVLEAAWDPRVGERRTMIYQDSEPERWVSVPPEDALLLEECR